MKILKSIATILTLAAVLSANCTAIGANPVTARNDWKQDRIWITYWAPPPETDAALKQAASEHFNLTWTIESGLDRAARHGFKVMLHEEAVLNPAALDNPAKKQLLDAMIDRVKNHPALEAYFLVDEPAAAQFAGWGRLVAYLREKDPAHVAFINLLPSYAKWNQYGVNLLSLDVYGDYLRQFVQAVKPGILSYDHYHFYRKSDPPDFFLNLEKVRNIANRNKIPFINIIQACQWTSRWRMPNAEELRFMVYSTLAYGGRGIAYFLYWGPTAYGGLYRDGKPMPVMPSVSKLNSEISILSPQLMSLKSIGVYHTNPLPNGTQSIPKSCPIKIATQAPIVLGLFADRLDTPYFMLVSRDYKNRVAATVSIKSGPLLSEFDRTTSTWKTIPKAGNHSSLQINLEPGDGRLFRISP